MGAKKPETFAKARRQARIDGNKMRGQKKPLSKIVN